MISLLYWRTVTFEEGLTYAAASVSMKAIKLTTGILKWIMH
jgi:hypothetical protein